MKYIKKEEPVELRSWFDGQLINGERINCDYRNGFPGDVRRAIHKHFLVEQGYLCCYIGIPIDEDSSHVEHLKPYHQCRDEGKYEDVSYLNLIAAYPGPAYQEDIDGKKYKQCPFGAHVKDEWYEADKFVSPLDEDCETRFRFDEFGAIAAANSEDDAAKETIARLVLNHERLKELRKEAIDEVLFPPDVELDESEWQIIADGNYSVRDENQKLPQFCFVIEQVARQLVYKA